MWEATIRAVLLLLPVLGVGWLAGRFCSRSPLLALHVACAIVFSFFFVSVVWHLGTAVRVPVTPASFALVSWFAFLLLLAVRWMGRRTSFRPARVLYPSSVWWTGSAAVVAGYALSYLLQAVLMPVYPASDAPIYHLPFAIEWVKAGRITLVPTPFGETAATYFPANSSCWYAWLIMVGGNELLAKAGQWPFLVAGALAVFSAARLLRAGTAAAVLAACAWTVAPHVLFFSSVALADLAVAACMAVGVALLLAWRRWGHKGALFASMVAIGTGAGSKLVAALFLAPVAAVVLLWVLLYSGERLPARVRVMCGCLVFGLAGCAFWYARNWLVTGNPVYPTHVRIGSHLLFHGWYTIDVLRATSPYAIPVENWPALLSIATRVMTPLMTPLYLLALLVGIFDHVRGTRTLVAIALLQWFAYWVINPYQTQERFLLGTLAIMAIVLARLLTLVPAFCVPVVLAVLFQPLFPQPDIWRLLGRREWILFDEFPALIRSLLVLGTIGRAGAVAVIGLLASLPLLAARRPGRLMLLTTLVALAVGVGGATAAIRYFVVARPVELRFYPVWELTEGWLALENASAPTGSRVAYAGTNLRFYLYCLGLRNSVVYVNVEGDARDLMHDFHRRAIERGRGLASTFRPQWGRESPDYRTWSRNLRALGVEYLFVTTVNVRGGTFNIADLQGFPIERQWADSHPEQFRLLNSNQFFRLYKVVAPRQTDMSE